MKVTQEVNSQYHTQYKNRLHTIRIVSVQNVLAQSLQYLNRNVTRHPLVRDSAALSRDIHDSIAQPEECLGGKRLGKEIRHVVG